MKLSLSNLLPCSNVIPCSNGDCPPLSWYITPKNGSTAPIIIQGGTLSVVIPTLVNLYKLPNANAESMFDFTKVEDSLIKNFIKLNKGMPPSDSILLTSPSSGLRLYVLYLVNILPNELSCNICTLYLYARNEQEATNYFQEYSHKVGYNILKKHMRASGTEACERYDNSKVTQSQGYPKKMLPKPIFGLCYPYYCNFQAITGNARKAVEAWLNSVRR